VKENIDKPVATLSLSYAGGLVKTVQHHEENIQQ
jgi:hypothetical protein